MGAPIGNQNAAKPKRWRLAIEKALERKGKDSQETLIDIAEKLLDAAMTADMQALRELGDRLDGKPAQAVVGSDEDPPIKAVHELLIRAIDATYSRPPEEGQ